MMTNQDLKFGSETIHSKSSIDFGIKSLATPIYQTSTYYFDTVEEAGETFAGERGGFAYSRGGNPTVVELEAKLAKLEGAEDAILTGSGMGAIGSVFLGLLSAGDHMISGDCLYGCSSHVIRNELSRFDISHTFVDTSDLDAVKSAVKDNTKLIYFETPTNPTIKVTDIEAIAEFAHEKDILVVVDNTFAPPPVQYPLKCGADLVVHSLTKYINGHGDVIAGAIMGPSEILTRLNSGIVTKLTGSILSPNDAFLIIRGMKTLELRMERHCENAIKVAEYLENHDYVERVDYPGLESHESYDIATKQMNGMYGAMITFELKDDIHGRSSFDSCKKLLNNMELATIAVSLGDSETLIQHPASMTHGSLEEEELKESGISKNQIRLSVGLENVEDIIQDFNQAFDQL